MSPLILTTFIIGFALRLVSLSISIRNERRLKADGAVEHGRRNTAALASLHFLFYFAALAEGITRGVQFDGFAATGLLLYAFSLAMLFHIISALSPIWTVKLIIAREHPLVTSPLFKYVRHPNYFLNILPELLGLALLMKSSIVAIILFPPYLLALGIRIAQEERAMRTRFPAY